MESGTLAGQDVSWGYWLWSNVVGPGPVRTKDSWKQGGAEKHKEARLFKRTWLRSLNSETRGDTTRSVSVGVDQTFICGLVGCQFVSWGHRCSSCDLMRHTALNTKLYISGMSWWQPAPLCLTGSCRRTDYKEWTHNHLFFLVDFYFSKLRLFKKLFTKSTILIVHNVYTKHHFRRSELIL